VIDVLEKLFLPVLDVLDITSALNPLLIGSFFLVAMLGEVYIQIPLLMESVWLLVGYQSRANSTALLNAALMLLAAQAGRQVAMLALYWFFPVLSQPFSRLLPRPVRWHRFYCRHFDHNHFDNRYLTTVPATLGMLTYLNGPVKVALIWRRRLRPLLVGTLLSGLVFDSVYLLGGAIFRTTELSIAYLPAVFLAVFLAFMYIQIKVGKRNAPLQVR